MMDSDKQEEEQAEVTYQTLSEFLQSTPPNQWRHISNLSVSQHVGVYCHRKFRPLSKPRLCYNTILLKGVSDGETKTKKLHPGV